jgi:DNA polymerase I-like protein with 3'-5' exonuclease and polymerase domains
LYSDIWPTLTNNIAKAKERMSELEPLIAAAMNPLQRRQYETLYNEAKKLCKENETIKKRLRELTKRATYASLYGSTAENLFIKLRSDEKLRDMGMEIEPEQCTRFVQMFPQMWPQIEAWRRQAVLTAVANKESVSALLGRKRPFPLGRLDPTQAVNYPVQAFAADLMDMCMLDLWEELDHERDWIIMQIHDAIVIETDEDRAEEVAALVTQKMTSVVELNGHKCLFPADAKIGQSWDQV